jgi:hypothetical protein
MQIEIINDTTAVVVTDSLETVLRAAQTLVNTEIDSCSIMTVEGVPVLSLKKGNIDTHLAILVNKTGTATPEEFFGIKKKEELEDFPLDEKIEDFDLDAPSVEKKEEPTAPPIADTPNAEEPQENSNLVITDDMKSLVQSLIEGKHQSLSILDSADNVISTALLNSYTEVTGIDLRNELRGGDPGDSSVSLEKNKEYNPDNLLLKRVVK